MLLPAIFGLENQVRLLGRGGQSVEPRGQPHARLADEVVDDRDRAVVVVGRQVAALDSPDVVLEHVAADVRVGLGGPGQGASRSVLHVGAFVEGYGRRTRAGESRDSSRFGLH